MEKKQEKPNTSQSAAATNVKSEANKEQSQLTEVVEVLSSLP